MVRLGSQVAGNDLRNDLINANSKDYRGNGLAPIRERSVDPVRDSGKKRKYSMNNPVYVRLDEDKEN